MQQHLNPPHHCDYCPEYVMTDIFKEGFHTVFILLFNCSTQPSTCNVVWSTPEIKKNPFTPVKYIQNSWRHLLFQWARQTWNTRKTPIKEGSPLNGLLEMCLGAEYFPVWFILHISLSLHTGMVGLAHLIPRFNLDEVMCEMSPC